MSDRYLTWCLQNGTFRNPGIEAPECMAMLALSLLVDSLLDGDYGGTGQYRAKLRQWLGVDRSFVKLRGIATMWTELAGWLDARVADGAPFRRLILPEIPATWTHIGYTRYLSFPTKRDLRFLERQIGRNPKLANDPAGLVRLLDSQVGSATVSFGLKTAFADFRMALRSGRASVDHRFWKLVDQARSAAGVGTAPFAVFRMEFDEDERRQYRLSCKGSADLLPRDVGSAIASSLLLDSPNLGPAVRRGVLFFQSSGLANWTATGEPPLGVGPFHVAVAGRQERLARGANADFSPSGGWIVTTKAVSSIAATCSCIRSMGRVVPGWAAPTGCSRRTHPSRANSYLVIRPVIGADAQPSYRPPTSTPSCRAPPTRSRSMPSGTPAMEAERSRRTCPK